MRYGQLVLGPAGSGKSTYCKILKEHGDAIRQQILVINLDPAAEQINYQPYADIRTLIELDDVMEDEEFNLGPNGGLVKCMEYLVDEELDWLQEQIGEEEDLYILFDCPGQIELYTHYDMMKRLADALASWNIRLCSVFILDTQFLLEMSKFLSGNLVALSTMVNLGLPAVNILSKVDLLSKQDREKVEMYLDPDSRAILLAEEDPATKWNRKHRQLTAALASVLDDYSLVSFVSFNIADEESIEAAKIVIDNTIQFGEEEEVRDRFPDELDENDDFDEGGGGGGGNGKYQ